MKIFISSAYINSDDLRMKISANCEMYESNIQFTILNLNRETRVGDTTILVATLSSAGIALAALLKGLFAIVQESKRKQIVIQTKDGTRIEVPYDCPKEKMEEIIKIIKALDSVKIEI